MWRRWLKAMDKTTKQLREKYKCIVRWCKELQSFDYYINDEVHRAETDNAPVDAIYKKDDGTWAIASEVSSPELRARLLAE